ncbi:MAG: type II toxin-antitoxin system VapC family toxin [SAR202 cluster bacterium]|nr:type II toxin-antitoxin system VapC family toxin [SAR202 cluster bacterium]
MNGWIVLDASFAVKLLVVEPFSDLAYALTAQWAVEGKDTVAPHFMFAEVANALYRKHLGGELSQLEILTLIDNLHAAKIQLMTPPSLYTHAVQLSSQLKQSTIYDSLYLALAQHLNSELWTADQRFYKAAVSVFPNVKWIGDPNLNS